jgi:tRNA(Ile)-lysidine synthase
MRPMIDAGGVIIVRPFLGVPRARLAAATAAAGLTPFDDPMNSDPRFARTAVRRFLAASGLDPAVLAGLAARFADLADRIDAEATASIAGVVAADEFAVAWLDRAAFASLPREVRGRVLVRVLMAVGGEDYPPRSPSLAGLMEAMVRADKGRFKRTLAGAVVERRGGRFAVYREAGRTPLPPVPVAPGETIVFDRRFAVAVDPGSVAEGLTVASLTIAEGVAVASRRASRGLPAGALAALPALRRDGEILAIPGLLDGPAAFRSLLAERLSRPPLFPIAIPIATIRSPSVNPAAIAVFPS